MTPSFSIIVPTTGRQTLVRALQSLARQPLNADDEVIVIGPGEAVRRVVDQFRYTHIDYPSVGNFGCGERRYGIPLAHGTHLAFLDDDDAYVPGAVAAMRAGVERYPDRPVMFKMIAPNGLVLWRESRVEIGNHGTPQFVTPNITGKVGVWGTRYEGDFDFCVSTLALYPPKALVWNSTIVCACRDWADRVWEERSCVASS